MRNVYPLPLCLLWVRSGWKERSTFRGIYPQIFIFVVPTAQTELPLLFLVGCKMYLILLIFVYNGITLYIIKDTRWGILGCSYRASSVRIAIRLPTNATLYFVYLFPFFTLHVSGSHKPIIRGIPSCFFIYNHLVHAVFMLFICLYTYNQMVVCIKKQLEIPLMMGS